MNKYAMLSVSVISLISSTVFADSLHSLQKNEALKLIEGNTISTGSMSTLGDKVINNTFTGYFDKSGKMEGKFSRPVRGQPQADVGIWKIKDDGSFCVTWDHWNNKKPNCLAIYAVKNGYIFINQGTGNFENVTLKDSVKAGNTLD